MLYIIDIVLRFRLGYHDEHSAVRDRRRIARHYMRHGSFATDLLASLPLEPLTLVIAPSVAPLLRMPRLLRVWQFWPNVNELSHILRVHNYYSFIKLFKLVAHPNH